MVSQVGCSGVTWNGHVKAVSMVSYIGEIFRQHCLSELSI